MIRKKQKWLYNLCECVMMLVPDFMLCVNRCHFMTLVLYWSCQLSFYLFCAFVLIVLRDVIVCLYCALVCLFFFFPSACFVCVVGESSHDGKEWDIFMEMAWKVFLKKFVLRMEVLMLMR